MRLGHSGTRCGNLGVRFGFCCNPTAVEVVFVQALLVSQGSEFGGFANPSLYPLSVKIVCSDLGIMLVRASFFCGYYGWRWVLRNVICVSSVN